MGVAVVDCVFIHVICWVGSGDVLEGVASEREDGRNDCVSEFRLSCLFSLYLFGVRGGSFQQWRESIEIVYARTVGYVNMPCLCFALLCLGLMLDLTRSTQLVI